MTLGIIGAVAERGTLNTIKAVPTLRSYSNLIALSQRTRLGDRELIFREVIVPRGLVENILNFVPDIFEHLFPARLTALGLFDGPRLFSRRIGRSVWAALRAAFDRGLEPFEIMQGRAAGPASQLVPIAGRQFEKAACPAIATGRDFGRVLHVLAGLFGSHSI